MRKRRGWGGGLLEGDRGGGARGAGEVCVRGRRRDGKQRYSEKNSFVSAKICLSFNRCESSVIQTSTINTKRFRPIRRYSDRNSPPHTHTHTRYTHNIHTPHIHTHMRGRTHTPYTHISTYTSDTYGIIR